MAALVAEVPLVTYCLRLADNALVLGHRVSEWCGHAPMLEEDIALANLGLDLIGQARLFYAYACEVEGRALEGMGLKGMGRDEDQLAYLRDAPAFRNVLLVERPNGDFAATMLRHFLYSAFAHPYLDRLAASSDPRLAEIAARAVKEMAYHVRHSGEWIVRLGDGTQESHERLASALADLWPFTGELFETDAVEDDLIAAGIAPDPAVIRPVWEKTVRETLDAATLAMPATGWMQKGGRTGRHSEHLGHMLAEMQFLQRAYPGATW